MQENYYKFLWKSSPFSTRKFNVNFPQSVSSSKRSKVSPFNCDFVSEIDNGSGVSYNLEPYSASSLSDLDGGSSDSV